MSSSRNQPDPAEIAIQEFAKVTGVDEGLAHFFLQDHDFNLQKGLNAYYRQMEREDSRSTANEAEDDDGNDSDCMIIEDDDDEDDDVVPMDTQEPSSTHDTSNKDEFPEDITVMTYNVDGIEEKNRQTRFKAAMNVIAQQNPEVILLQEVVHSHMDLINQVLAPMYHVITPLDKGMPYFTVTLVSKNIICRTQEVIPFANTSMGRTMTVFDGYWQKLHLVVIHSHLESMREHADARKQQFSQCLKRMEASMDPNTLVIFAGDLNIRDAELPVINPQIKDAWITAGSKADTRYTWDNMKNSNKGLPKNVRCRFDRVYFNGPYKKVDFSLAGTQSIRKCLCYPSDHFAVVCRFWDPPETD